MNISEYLYDSYTSFHAVANAKAMLDESGFKPLDLKDKWEISIGGKYYVTKNDSAIIAFSVGAEKTFQIVGCHTDSPSLKVKGSTLVGSAEGLRANVEKYGGLVLHSMLDIPLAIAGRLIVKDGEELKTELVRSDFNVNIPGVCIHHNPTVNNGVALSVQKDMLPLIGGENDNLYDILASGKEVVDGDLYVVPAVKPYYSGSKNDLLVSPRIDNLTSVYSAIKAVISCEPKGIALACCFDNEEIGNGTKQGAKSVWLKTVLEKINRALGRDEDDFIESAENGFVLSVDNGHAVHPAHPELSDITETVYLNGGIVIKHHTNYSTDGYSSAVVKKLLDENGIAWQDYYNNSDIRCGSTLGLETSVQFGMNACDIGLAQLAMHSAIETVGANDVPLMENALTKFFEK